jgi:hypothetical protein
LVSAATLLAHKLIENTHTTNMLKMHAMRCTLRLIEFLMMFITVNSTA